MTASEVDVDLETSPQGLDLTGVNYNLCPPFPAGLVLSAVKSLRLSSLSRHRSLPSIRRRMKAVIVGDIEFMRRDQIPVFVH